jgi:hypothetical protein
MIGKWYKVGELHCEVTIGYIPGVTIGCTIRSSLRKPGINWLRCPVEWQSGVTPRRAEPRGLAHREPPPRGRVPLASGLRRHSTLPLTAIDRHPLVIYTAVFSRTGPSSRGPRRHSSLAHGRHSTASESSAFYTAING